VAELALKIGDSENPAGYKDGDILCAFSDHRIASAHLGNICHPKFAVRDSRSKLIAPGTSLVETMYLETRQYKFEAITEGGNRKLKRIVMADLTEEIFDDDPTLYITRRRQEWLS